MKYLKKTPGSVVTFMRSTVVPRLFPRRSAPEPALPSAMNKINSVSASGGSIQIHFIAVAGKTYTILKRDILADDHWVKLRDITAQTSTQELSVSLPNDNSQHFYRLVTPAI